VSRSEVPGEHPSEREPVVTNARIIGAAEIDYERHPASELETSELLARAARLALEDAGVRPSDVDGFGVSSFTLSPDNCIDLVVRLGLRVSWMMDARSGGASGIDMLLHAVRAVDAGDATTIVLVAGDTFRPGDFRTLVDNYNVATREHLAPLPFGGPNALFALVTTRHMRHHGLSREDYGQLVIAQRTWAGGNPNAAYRSALSLDEYLAAEMVAEPLGMFDCVPVVAGANAVVVARADHGVRVRAVRALYNADLHDGDGTASGLAELVPAFWADSGVQPDDVDVALVYDDYPVMVLVQLEDLGFGAPRETLRRIADRSLPVNTSGGQLSAGQAGAAGGMHLLVEAVTQLRGGGGSRQVDGARLALVTGYGMVAYRYGACANAALLESE
jgi:acetyl-CoA acetyltransferase